MTDNPNPQQPGAAQQSPEQSVPVPQAAPQVQATGAQQPAEPSAPAPEAVPQVAAVGAVASTSEPVQAAQPAVAVATEPQVETADESTEADAQEEQAIPEHYFLLYPDNETVVAGDSRKLPPLGARMVFIVGLVFLLIGVGLVVYTASLWGGIAEVTRAGAPAPQGTIPVAVVWTLVAFFYNVFVLGLFLSGLQVVTKRRALEKRGEIVWGEVMSASGKQDAGGKLRLTLEYQFQKPKRRFSRRRRIEDKVTETRDVEGESVLPTPGTPVAVLYLTPENYELL